MFLFNKIIKYIELFFLFCIIFKEIEHYKRYFIAI